MTFFSFVEFGSWEVLVQTADLMHLLLRGTVERASNKNRLAPNDEDESKD